MCQVYYTTPVRKSEVKGYWCHACYTDHRSDYIEVSETGRLRKSDLEKKKNDEEVCLRVIPGLASQPYNCTAAPHSGRAAT